MAWKTFLAIKKTELVGLKIGESRRLRLARKMKGLMVLTPDDEAMVAALTSFRLDGVTSTSANDSVVRHLAEKFGVLTVRRTGPVLRIRLFLGCQAFDSAIPGLCT
ncbi:MAG TPA: hypothetical protein VHQ64_00915 [Pyrinomonadaceae bacterium]|nr:hypothetical protein [Pyrinomonadaceae bacterium]